MKYFRVEPRQPNLPAHIEFFAGSMMVHVDQPSTNFTDKAELPDGKSQLLDKDLWWPKSTILWRFRWQLVAARIMASMKVTLPLEAHSELFDLTAKTMAPEFIVYH
jgi:hypothetical protein